MMWVRDGASRLSVTWPPNLTNPSAASRRLEQPSECSLRSRTRDRKAHSFDWRSWVLTATGESGRSFTAAFSAVSKYAT